MITCPYCEKEAQFSSSFDFYGKDYGTNVYFCPDCDAHIKTFKNSLVPNGTMANEELRELRKTIHGIFNELLNVEEVDSYLLFKKISQHIFVSPDEVHISYLDEFQCDKIIRLYELEELQKGTS